MRTRGPGQRRRGKKIPRFPYSTLSSRLLHLAFQVAKSPLYYVSCLKLSSLAQSNSKQVLSYCICKEHIFMLQETMST